MLQKFKTSFQHEFVENHREKNVFLQPFIDRFKIILKIRDNNNNNNNNTKLCF